MAVAVRSRSHGLGSVPLMRQGSTPVDPVPARYEQKLKGLARATASASVAWPGPFRQFTTFTIQAIASHLQYTPLQHRRSHRGLGPLQPLFEQVKGNVERWVDACPEKKIRGDRAWAPPCERIESPVQSLADLRALGTLHSALSRHGYFSYPTHLTRFMKLSLPHLSSLSPQGLLPVLTAMRRGIHAQGHLPQYWGTKGLISAPVLSHHCWQVGFGRASLWLTSLISILRVHQVASRRFRASDPAPPLHALADAIEQFTFWAKTQPTNQVPANFLPVMQKIAGFCLAFLLKAKSPKIKKAPKKRGAPAPTSIYAPQFTSGLAQIRGAIKRHYKHSIHTVVPPVGSLGELIDLLSKAARGNLAPTKGSKTPPLGNLLDWVAGGLILQEAPAPHELALDSLDARSIHFAPLTREAPLHVPLGGRNTGKGSLLNVPRTIGQYILQKLNRMRNNLITQKRIACFLARQDPEKQSARVQDAIAAAERYDKPLLARLNALHAIRALQKRYATKIPPFSSPAALRSCRHRRLGATFRCIKALIQHLKLNPCEDVPPGVIIFLTRLYRLKDLLNPSRPKTKISPDQLDPLPITGEDDSSQLHLALTSLKPVTMKEIIRLCDLFNRFHQPPTTKGKIVPKQRILNPRSSPDYYLFYKILTNTEDANPTTIWNQPQVRAAKNQSAKLSGCFTLIRQLPVYKGQIVPKQCVLKPRYSLDHYNLLHEILLKTKDTNPTTVRTQLQDLDSKFLATIVDCFPARNGLLLPLASTCAGESSNLAKMRTQLAKLEELHVADPITWIPRVEWQQSSPKSGSSREHRRTQRMLDEVQRQKEAKIADLLRPTKEKIAELQREKEGVITAIKKHATTSEDGEISHKIAEEEKRFKVLVSGIEEEIKPLVSKVEVEFNKKFASIRNRGGVHGTKILEPVNQNALLYVEQLKLEIEYREKRLIVLKKLEQSPEETSGTYTVKTLLPRKSAGIWGTNRRSQKSRESSVLSKLRQNSATASSRGNSSNANGDLLPVSGYSLISRRKAHRHLATKVLGIVIFTLFAFDFIIATYNNVPLNPVLPSDTDYTGVTEYLQLDAEAILALPSDAYGYRYARFLAEGACYLYADTYDLDSPNVAGSARINFGCEEDTFEERKNYDCLPGPNYYSLYLESEDWGDDPVLNEARVYNITIDPFVLDCFKMICVQSAVIAIGSDELQTGESNSKDFVAGGPVTVLFDGELMNFATLSIVIDFETPSQIILKGLNSEEAIDKECAIVSQVLEDSEFLKFPIYLAQGTHTITVWGEGSFFYEILHTDANFDDDFLSDVEEAMFQRGSCLDILTANLYGTKREEKSQISTTEYLTSPEQLWLDGEIEFRVPESFGNFYCSSGLSLDLWIQVTQGTYTNFSINDGNLEPDNTTLYGFHSNSAEEATLYYADGTQAKFLERDLMQVGDHYVGDIVPGTHKVKYKVLYNPLVDSEVQLFVAGTGVEIVANEELLPDTLDTDIDGLPDLYDSSPYASLVYHGGSLMQLVLPVSPSGTEDLQVQFQIKKPTSSIDLPTDRIMKWQPGSPTSPYVTLKYVMVLYGPGDSARKTPLDWWDLNPLGQDMWNSLSEMGNVLNMPVECYNLVAIDGYGTSHLDYSQGKVSWGGDADPLPLLGYDSAYGYFDIVYPVEAQQSFTFGPLDYSRDNPALADGALDLRVTFQIAVIETDENNNSKNLLGLYPLTSTEDIMIQSISGRFVQEANFLLAAPSTASENELFYQYCQRPDVPIASGGNDYAEGRAGMDSILQGKILGEGFGRRNIASFEYDVNKPETYGIVEASAYAYQLAYYNLSQDFIDIPANEFPAGWDCYENNDWASRTDVSIKHDGFSSFFDTSDILLTSLSTYPSDIDISEARADSAVQIMPLRAGTARFSIGVGRLSDTFDAGIVSVGLENDGTPKITPIAVITFANGLLKYKEKSLLSGYFTPGHLYEITLSWDIDANLVAITVDGTEISFSGNEGFLQNIITPSQFRVWTMAPSEEGYRFCGLADLNIIAPRASLVAQEACVTYYSFKERSMDFTWKLNQTILFDQSSEVFFYEGTDTFRYPSSGNFPLSWQLESVPLGDGYAAVTDSFLGHSRVLDLFDGTSDNSAASIYRQFGTAKTSGTIEFWLYVPLDAMTFEISLGQGTGIGFRHKFIDGEHLLYNFAGTVLGSISPGRWHSIRLFFDCDGNGGLGSFSTWIDNVCWWQDIKFPANVDFIDRLVLSTSLDFENYHVFFDKFGYDWEGYELGSNTVGVRVREADQFVAYPGNYFATFEPGTVVSGSIGPWGFAQSSASIVRNVNAHTNVLKFGGSGYTQNAFRFFDYPLSSKGTVLFWFCLPENFNTDWWAQFGINPGGTDVIRFLIDDGDLKYANMTEDGIKYVKLADLWGGVGNWWYVQANFDCEGGYADLYVGGVGAGVALNVSFLKPATDISSWKIETPKEIWIDGVELIPEVIDLNDIALEAATPLSYTNIHYGDLEAQYTWSTVMDKYAQYSAVEVSQMGSSSIGYSSFYNGEVREAKFVTVTGLPTRVTLKRATDSDSDRIIFSDLLQVEYCIDDCMDKGDLPGILSEYSWDGEDVPDDSLLVKDLIVETSNEVYGLVGVCPVFLSQTFGDAEKRYVDSTVLAGTVGAGALALTTFIITIFEDLIFEGNSQQGSNGPRAAGFSPRVAQTPVPEKVQAFIDNWVSKNKMLQGFVEAELKAIAGIQDLVQTWTEKMFPKNPAEFRRYGSQGVWVDIGEGDVQYADNAQLKLTYNVERILNDYKNVVLGLTRFNEIMGTDVGATTHLWMPVEWNSEGWSAPTPAATVWIEKMRQKYPDSFKTVGEPPDPTRWKLDDLMDIPRELVTDVPAGEWSTRVPWYEGKNVGLGETLNYRQGCFFAKIEMTMTWLLKWEIMDGFLNGKPVDEPFFRNKHAGGYRKERVFLERYGIPLWSTLSDNGKTFLQQAKDAGYISEATMDKILTGKGFHKIVVYAPPDGVDDGWLRPAGRSYDGQEMFVWYNKKTNALKCEGVWYAFDYPFNLFRGTVRGHDNGFNVIYTLKNAIYATKALLSYVAQGGLGEDAEARIRASPVPGALARVMLILGYEPGEGTHAGKVYVDSQKKMSVLAEDNIRGLYNVGYKAEENLVVDNFIEKTYLESGMAEFLLKVIPGIKENALKTLIGWKTGQGEKPEHSGKAIAKLIKDPNFVVMKGDSDIALFTQFCDMLKTKNYVDYELSINEARKTAVMGFGRFRSLPSELEMKLRYIIASLFVQYGGLELTLTRLPEKAGASHFISIVNLNYESLFSTTMDFPGRTELNRLLVGAGKPPVRNIYEAVYAYLRTYAGLDNAYVIQRLMNFNVRQGVMIIPRLDISFFTELITQMANKKEFRDAESGKSNVFLYDLVGMRYSVADPATRAFFECIERALGLPYYSDNSYTHENGKPIWNQFAGGRQGRDINSYNLIMGQNAPVQVEYVPAAHGRPAHYVIIYRKAYMGWDSSGHRTYLSADQYEPGDLYEQVIVPDGQAENGYTTFSYRQTADLYGAHPTFLNLKPEIAGRFVKSLTPEGRNVILARMANINSLHEVEGMRTEVAVTAREITDYASFVQDNVETTSPYKMRFQFGAMTKSGTFHFGPVVDEIKVSEYLRSMFFYDLEVVVGTGIENFVFTASGSNSPVGPNYVLKPGERLSVMPRMTARGGESIATPGLLNENIEAYIDWLGTSWVETARNMRAYNHYNPARDYCLALQQEIDMQQAAPVLLDVQRVGERIAEIIQEKNAGRVPTEKEITAEIESYLTAKYGVVDQGLSLLLTTYLLAQATMNRIEAAVQSDNTQMYEIAGLQLTFTTIMIGIRVNALVKTIKYASSVPDAGLLARNIDDYVPDLFTECKQIGFGFLMDVVTGVFDIWTNIIYLTEAGFTQEQAIQDSLIRFVPPIIFEAVVDVGILVASEILATFGYGTASAILSSSSVIGIGIAMLASMLINWAWNAFIDGENAKCTNEISIVFDTGRQELNWYEALATHGGLRVGDSIFYSTLWENDGANSVWLRQKAAAGPHGMLTSDTTWGQVRAYTLSSNYLSHVATSPGDELYFDIINSCNTYYLGNFDSIMTQAWREEHRYGFGSSGLGTYDRYDLISWPTEYDATWVIGGWAGASYGFWGPIVDPFTGEILTDVGRYWPAASKIGYDPNNYEGEAQDWTCWDYFAYNMPLLVATPELCIHTKSQVDYIYHNFTPEMGRIKGEETSQVFPLGDSNGDNYIDPMLEQPVRVLEPSLVSFLASCEETHVDSIIQDLDDLQTSFADEIGSYQWGDAFQTGNQLINMVESGLYFDELGLDTLESRLIDATRFVGSYSYLSQVEGEVPKWTTRDIPRRVSDNYYLLYVNDLVEWNSYLGWGSMSSLWDAGWRALEPSLGVIYKQPFGSVETWEVPSDWQTATGDPHCKVYVENGQLVVGDKSDPYLASATKNFGPLVGGELSWSVKMRWDVDDGELLFVSDDDEWADSTDSDLHMKVGSQALGFWVSLLDIEMFWSKDEESGTFLCNGQPMGTFGAERYVDFEIPGDIFKWFTDHWAQTDTYYFKVKINSLTRLAEVYINGVLAATTAFASSVGELVPDSFRVATAARYGYDNENQGVIDDFNVICNDWYMGNLDGYSKTNPGGILLVPRDFIPRQRRLLNMSGELEEYLEDMPLRSDIRAEYSWGDEIPILDPGDVFSGFISFTIEGSDTQQVQYSLHGPRGWDLVPITATLPLQSLHEIPISFIVPQSAQSGKYYVTLNISTVDGAKAGSTVFFNELSFRVRYNESLALDFYGLPNIVDFATPYLWGQLENTGSVSSSVLIVEDMLPLNGGYLTGDGQAPLLHWDFDVASSNFDLKAGTGVSIWSNDHVTLSASSSTTFYKNVSLLLQPGDSVVVRFKHNYQDTPVLQMGEDIYLAQFGVPDANGYYEIILTLSDFSLIDCVDILVSGSGSLWVDFIGIDRSLSNYAPITNLAFTDGYNDPLAYDWGGIFGSDSDTIEIDVPLTNIGYVDAANGGMCFDDPVESSILKIGADGIYSTYLEIPSLPQDFASLLDFNLVERYLYLMPFGVPVDPTNEDLRAFECEAIIESTLTGSTIPRGDPVYWWLSNASLPADRTAWWSWDITNAFEDYLCINTTSPSIWSFYSDASGGFYEPFVKYVFRKHGVQDNELFVQGALVQGETFEMSHNFSGYLNNVTLFKDDKIWIGYESDLDSPFTLTLNNSQPEFENQSFTLYPSEGYTMVELNIEPEIMNATSLHIKGTIKFGEVFGLGYIGIFRYQPAGTPFGVISANGFYKQTIYWSEVEGYTPLSGGTFTFDGTWGGFEPMSYSSSIAVITMATPLTTAVSVDSARSDQNLLGEPLIVSNNAGILSYTYFGMPASPYMPVIGSVEGIEFGVSSDTSTVPLQLLTSNQYDAGTVTWNTAPDCTFSGLVDPVLPTWGMTENISQGCYFALKQTADGSTVLTDPIAGYKYPKIGIDASSMVLQTDIPEELRASLIESINLVIGTNTRIRVRFNNTKASDELSLIFGTNKGQREWVLTDSPTGGFREAIFSFNADDFVSGELILQEIIICADLGVDGRAILDYIVIEAPAPLTPIGSSQGHRDVVALQGGLGHISSANLTFDDPMALGEFDFWVYSPGTNGSICITFEGQTELGASSLDTISLDLANWTLSVVNKTQSQSFASFLGGWYQFSVLWNASWHNFTLSCMNTTLAGTWNFSSQVVAITGIRFGVVDGQRAFLIDALGVSSDSDFVPMGNLFMNARNGTGYYITLDPGDTYDFNYVSPPRSWFSRPGIYEIFASVYSRDSILIDTYSQEIMVPEFHDQAFTNLSVVDFIVSPEDVGAEPDFACYLRLQNLGNTQSVFNLGLEGILGGAAYAFTGTGVVGDTVTLEPGESIELRLDVLSIGYQTTILYITATEAGQVPTKIPCLLCTNYPAEWVSRPSDELAYILGDPNPHLLSWTIHDGTVSPDLATFTIRLDGLEIINSPWAPDPISGDFTYSIDVSGLPAIGTYEYEFTIDDGRRSLISDMVNVVVYNDLPQLMPFGQDFYMECNRTYPVSLDWTIYDLQAVDPIYSITIDGEAYITEMPWIWDAGLQKGTISLDITAMHLPARVEPYQVRLSARDGDPSTECTDEVDVYIYNERPAIECFPYSQTYIDYGDFIYIFWVFMDDSFGADSFGVPTVTSRTYIDDVLVREVRYDDYCQPDAEGNANPNRYERYFIWSQDLGGINQWYTIRLEVDDGLGFNSTSTNEVQCWVGNPPPVVSLDTPSVQFEYNTNPNAMIQWTPVDVYVTSPTYCVYVDSGDGTGFVPYNGAPYYGSGEGTWTSGVPISIDVSTLKIGNYIFALEISDGFGMRIPKEDLSTHCIVDVYNAAPQFLAEPGGLVEFTIGVENPIISWQVFDLSVLVGDWSILKVTGDSVTTVFSGTFTPGSFPVDITVDSLGLVFDSDISGDHIDYAIVLRVLDGFGLQADSACTVRMWNLAPVISSSPGNRNILDHGSGRLTWTIQDNSVRGGAGYWQITPPSGIPKGGYWDGSIYSPWIDFTELVTLNPSTPAVYTYRLDIYDGFVGGKFSDGTLYGGTVFSDEVSIIVRGDAFHEEKPGWGKYVYSTADNPGEPYLSGDHMQMHVDAAQPRGKASFIYTAVPCLNTYGNVFSVVTCTDYGNGLVDNTAQGIVLGSLNNGVDSKRYLSFMVGDDATSHFIIIDAVAADGTQTTYYRLNIPGEYTHVWLYMNALYSSSNEIRYTDFWYSLDGQSWTYLYELTYYYWAPAAYTQFVGLQAVNWNAFSEWTGKFDFYATFPYDMYWMYQ